MSVKDGYELFATRNGTPKQEPQPKAEARPRGTVTTGRELFSDTRTTTRHTNESE